MPLLRRRLHPEVLTGRAAPAVAPRRQAESSRVLWRISDGKPGHDNQSLGLVEALQRRLPISCYDVPVQQGGSMLHWLQGRFPAGELLPDPWLIVGAGHATHLPMLSARRARGGRAAVLMTPDLPKSLFDLCVIPEHDRPRSAVNVLVTLGSLNRMQSIRVRDRDRGLLMVGGPSRHYHWYHDGIVDQILRVIRYSPVRHWVLTTSRRTPPGFAERIRQALFNQNLKLTIVNWRDTADQWLVGQLRRSCCAWVTEDSVSMIYEVLTAGLPAGVLSVPARNRNRIVSGVRKLADSGNVMMFHDWSKGHPLPRPRQVFDEANRVAGWICRQWGSE